RARFVLGVHLLLEVVVDEGALLQATRHVPSSLLSALLAGTAATDDELVARLPGTPGAALGGTPGRDGVAATGGPALATTVRVVHRVHHDTADGGALALPPHAAGLAPADVDLLGVADLTDGGAAPGVDPTDLAGGHAQRGVGALLREELDARPGGAGHLGPATGTQLHGVDRGAVRDVAQREVVPDLDVGRRAVLDPSALVQLARGQDVTLLAVGVVQQRDACGAVRVVLDVRDLGRDTVLVVATEVDDAVGALVTAAAVAGGDAARGVATAGLAPRADERLLRRVPGGVDAGGVGAAAAAGRGRLVLADGHVLLPCPLRQPWPPKMSIVPSRRVTIARLTSLRLPVPNRVRRALPGRFMVCTESTLTSKICSTAILIWVLLARGSTMNVYLPSSRSP